jgi:metallo-beta-lactamase family protein
MEITFLGAARQVTGSCYLFETATARFLVECGMFQGGHEAPAHNHAPFAFDPSKLDFVLLTHAHIDHSGLLPKLTAAGYTGLIYATEATVDLLGVMLPDSAHIQESEAERAQRYRSRRRSQSSRETVTPLYTTVDAENCLLQLRPTRYDEDYSPHADVRCRFREAGHILGSAILEIWITENGKTTKVVMSGDLGELQRPILRDPTRIEDADILFIESTYGNREHKELTPTLEELVDVVDTTLNVKGGNVIVPAFAVGRTQELLYHLYDLTRQGRLRHLNVYVDSPMATAATRVTAQHLELFDAESRRLADWLAAGRGLPTVTFTASAEESMALNHIRSGAIIISASGMCTAGRIKHHLRHNLGRAENSVLITGYQAQGTLGRQLVDGAERVKIFGKEIEVRASVHTLGGFSAHAGQAGLLAWAAGFQQAPRQTFVVHGEETAALTLAEKLRAERGWAVTVPLPGATVTV